MEKEKKDKTNNNKMSMLTIKQENFCQYYVDMEGNASEAYRMAYDTKNMQIETIWREASRLMATPKVATRINQLKQERAEQSKVKREKVEQVLMDIITNDPSEIFIYDEATGKVKVKNVKQLPKRVRNAIRKITNNKGMVSYEFNGKTEAARLLGAWNGWDAPREVNLRSEGSIAGELMIGFDDDEE